MAAIVLWCAAIHIPVISPATADTGQGVIAGRVLDMDTGRGVDGAKVSVRAALTVITAISDSTGAYRLEGVPAGEDFRVEASSGGYRTADFPATVKAGKETVRNCTLDGTYIDLFYPNGGEPIFAGSWVDVRWESGGVETLKVELSINGGRDWFVVGEGVDAKTGVWTWDVPDIPSPDCLIRLRDEAGSGLMDASDAPFGNTSI